MECHKRTFFVRIVGPQVLTNTEIILKDNKSGKSVTQAYPEVDPGPRSGDLYFSIEPSSRWDEDYAVTANSRESHSSQELIVRSAQHQIQFATQVTIGNDKTPALSCMDELLPKSYQLASGERRHCLEVMKLDVDAPAAVQASSYQRADGTVTVLKLRTLPSPSELDQQSDARHIMEYQKGLLGPTLRKYANSRLTILYAGGPNALAYAKEWRDLFSERWQVHGPDPAPNSDERIIDLQMSIGNSHQSAKAKDLLNAIDGAGIKHRTHPVVDPAVASDSIVLWVGPKSPKDAAPDLCAPAQLSLITGSPQACDLIAQTGGDCAFPPP